MTVSQEGLEVWQNLTKDYKESLAEFFEEPDEAKLLNLFTCSNCAIVTKCELKFDSYNTDGDCLAEK